MTGWDFWRSRERGNISCTWEEHEFLWYFCGSSQSLAPNIPPLAVCTSCSSRWEVEIISPSHTLECGLILWLTLTNRMWWKWCFRLGSFYSSAHLPYCDKPKWYREVREELSCSRWWPHVSSQLKVSTNWQPEHGSSLGHLSLSNNCNPGIITQVGRPSSHAQTTHKTVGDNKMVIILNHEF